MSLVVGLEGPTGGLCVDVGRGGLRGDGAQSAGGRPDGWKFRIESRRLFSF